MLKCSFGSEVNAKIKENEQKWGTRINLQKKWNQADGVSWCHHKRFLPHSFGYSEWEKKEV